MQRGFSFTKHEHKVESEAYRQLWVEGFKRKINDATPPRSNREYVRGTLRLFSQIKCIYYSFFIYLYKTLMAQGIQVCIHKFENLILQLH